MSERKCSLCTHEATCTVDDEPMCEAHGMYWAGVRKSEMVRFVRG